jgi:hypothetical protein
MAITIQDIIISQAYDEDNFDNEDEYYDVNSDEINSEDECYDYSDDNEDKYYDVDSDEISTDEDNDDEQEQMEIYNESSSSLLNFILTLFLRITQHYNIPNNAVIALLWVCWYLSYVLVNACQEGYMAHNLSET